MSLVLVKVGESPSYMRASDVTLAMDQTALLEALEDSRMFGRKFIDVALADCFVEVASGAQDGEPTSDFRPLGSRTTLADLAGDAPSIFVRVRLPPLAAPLAASRGELARVSRVVFTTRTTRAAQVLTERAPLLLSRPRAHSMQAMPWLHLL